MARIGLARQYLAQWLAQRMAWRLLGLLAWRLGLGLGIWLGLGRMVVESVVVGTWMGMVGSFVRLGLPLPVSMAQLQRELSFDVRRRG